MSLAEEEKLGSTGPDLGGRAHEVLDGSCGWVRTDMKLSKCEEARLGACTLAPKERPAAW